MENNVSGYDIVGDIHGCYDELCELLVKLGYCHHVDDDTHVVVHPHKRKLISVGDFADRGPQNAKTYELLMDMHDQGILLAVLGNHDDKLRRYLKGNKIRVSHGLDTTITELKGRKQKFRDRVHKFLERLPVRLDLDEDKLLISHAGLIEKYHGPAETSKQRKAMRGKCLYGETTGKTDENGFPERLDWAATYSGKRIVVHGHVKDLDGPIIKNNVYAIDTGCVFGGRLTALRYPKMEIVSVDAKANYRQLSKSQVAARCQDQP